MGMNECPNSAEHMCLNTDLAERGPLLRNTIVAGRASLVVKALLGLASMRAPREAGEMQ